MKLNLPLVSTVITNHNYANYIKDALQSVKDQTYRPLECIVIDDASTDNSVSVIEKFIEENQKDCTINFRLIKIEKNIGQLGGFIRGIQEAKGIFINFLDADDILFPDFVNTHVQILLEFNVGMSVCHQVIIDGNNQLITATDDDWGSDSNKNIYPVSEIQPFDIFAGICTEKKFDAEESPIAEIIPDPPFGFWGWAPTSNVMFRKAGLQLFNFTNQNKTWKICADRLFLNLIHYNFGSCRIHRRLIGYRRHADNNFTEKISFGMNNYMSANMRKKGGDRNAEGIGILKLLKNSTNDKITLDLFEHCYLAILPALSCTEMLKHPVLIASFLFHSSKPYSIRLIRNLAIVFFNFFIVRYRKVSVFCKEIDLAKKEAAK